MQTFSMVIPTNLHFNLEKVTPALKVPTLLLEKQKLLELGPSELESSEGEKDEVCFQVTQY